VELFGREEKKALALPKEVAEPFSSKGNFEMKEERSRTRAREEDPWGFSQVQSRATEPRSISSAGISTVRGG
jgi:hypothetical protein